MGASFDWLTFLSARTPIQAGQAQMPTYRKTPKN
jgi:hypothetical protein